MLDFRGIIDKDDLMQKPLRTSVQHGHHRPYKRRPSFIVEADDNGCGREVVQMGVGFALVQPRVVKVPVDGDAVTCETVEGMSLELVVELLLFIVRFEVGVTVDCNSSV